MALKCKKNTLICYTVETFLLFEPSIFSDCFGAIMKQLKVLLALIRTNVLCDCHDQNLPFPYCAGLSLNNLVTALYTGN